MRKLYNGKIYLIYIYFHFSYNYTIKINPKNSVIWNDKGVALYNLENYEEAIEW